MRRLTLIAMLMVPVLAATTFSEERFSFEPSEAWGYSSEDFGEGSYLGVDTRDVTSDRLAALKLKEEHGVEVTMVDQDAPAGKAGIRERDVILSVNGTGVESVEQLRRLIRETPPGRVITLAVSRDGEPLTVKVQLADRKKAFAYKTYNGHDKSKTFSFEMPAMPQMPILPEMDLPVSVVVVHSSMRSGLMVENLTPQLGDFFGAKNGQGVLVRSVEKGSRAEKAGFHAGDVIVKVNDQAVADSGDFSHALRARKPGTAVPVGIIRDRKELTLTLTLPERSDSGRIQEQGFEIPEIDAETRIDLSEVNSEIAKAKPQIEFAVREVERERPEIERAMRELDANRTLLERDMRRMAEELRRQQRDLRKQICATGACAEI